MARPSSPTGSFAGLDSRRGESKPEIAEHLHWAVGGAPHGECIGRESLLKTLDRRLGLAASADGSDPAEVESHSLLVLGGPGSGKSALLAEYVRHVSQAPSTERRGIWQRLMGGGNKQPATPRPFLISHALHTGSLLGSGADDLVRSLLGQLRAQFSQVAELNELYLAASELRPARRLSLALEAVSEQCLVPVGRRLLVVVDSLDELSGSTAPFPTTLPALVSMLCSARSGTRPGLLPGDRGQHTAQRLDLSDLEQSPEQDAALLGYWQTQAKRFAPPLSEAVIEAAVMKSQGSFLHAVLLRGALAALSPAERTPEIIPTGAAACVEWIYERARRGAAGTAVDSLVGALLAAHAAAQGPLPAEVAAALSGGRETLAAALAALGPLVEKVGVETANPSASGYELDRHVAALLAPHWQGDGLSFVHQKIAELLNTASSLQTRASDPLRQYGLRAAIAHRARAGDAVGALSLGSDLGWLSAVLSECGASALLHSLRAAVQALPQGPIRKNLRDITQALTREDSWLREVPGALTGLLYNRLIRQGFSTAMIARTLTFPSSLPLLRLRFPLQSDDTPDAACFEVAPPPAAGQESAVLRCACPASDERHVLIGTGDGRVLLYQLDDDQKDERAGRYGRPVWQWPESPDPRKPTAILGCRRLADGQRALTWGEDGTLRIFSLDSGAVLASVKVSANPIHDVCVLADGQLACAVGDGAVHFLAPTAKGAYAVAGRSLRSDGELAPMRAILALPDGRLVTGGEDRDLKIWDLSTGQVVQKLVGHTRAVSALGWTSQGSLLSASLDGTLRSWELGSGRSQVIGQHEDSVLACILIEGAETEHALTACGDGSLRLWDLQRAEELATLSGHSGAATGVAMAVRSAADLGLSGDGHDGALPNLISVGHDGTLRLWDLWAAERLHSRRGHRGLATALAVRATTRATESPQRLVSASRDRTLKVWDLSSGRHLRTLSGHAASVDECALLPDGARVVSASYDATLKVWDLQSGEPLTTLRGHSGWVSACAPLPGGERMVSAAMDGTLRIWDVNTGEALRSLSGHTDAITSCTVLPDGERLVSASADGTLRIWKIATGAQIATLHGHKGSVDRCAILPGSDGTPEQVLSASSDSTLKLWRLDNGEHVRTLSGHSAWVSAVAVFPDGKRAVSGSGDETLRVWDLVTGKTLAELKGHRAAIYACTVIPAGGGCPERVVSAAGDGTLRVFDPTSGRCLAVLYGRPSVGFFCLAVVCSSSSDVEIYAGDVQGNIWMLTYCETT